MPQLNKTAIKRMMRIIEEQSYFTSYSFKFDDSNENDTYMKIVFKDDNKYYFEILNKHKDSRRTGISNVYLVIQSPGKFMEVDQHTINDFDRCFDYLKNWLKFLEQELRSIHPLVGDIEELRREFNERLEEHIKDKSVHFDANEIESLREMLANLEQKFETELKISKEQLEQVKSELEKLKQDLDVFSKKTWWRTAGNKIINMTSQFISSKEGHQLLADSIKKLLSPGE